MNKSSSSTSPLKNLNLQDDWSSHPIIEWITENKKILLFGLIGLFAVLILAYGLIAIQTTDAEKDFFQAQTAYAQLQKGDLTSPDSPAFADLKQLDEIMQRHPEIKPKYEGTLAQMTLLSGQSSMTQHFVKDIFQRTQSDSLGLYQDYTQNSLLIAEGHYKEAIEKAQLLKSSLNEKGDKDNPLLYVFNLFRLAMLYQQTNQPHEEMKGWEELQHQPNRLTAIQALNTAFNIGQASLGQYIEFRQKELAQIIKQ